MSSGKWPNASTIKDSVDAIHESSGSTPAGAVSKEAGDPSSNASQFNQMLNQYNSLQQQTMLENMEMQKAQQFWNPLESMSKKDATS